MTKVRLAALAAVTAVGLGLGSMAVPASAINASDPHDIAEEIAREFGIQQVPKASASARKASPGADPHLSLLPEPEKVDLAYWKARARQKSVQRTAAVKAQKPALRKALAAPLLVDEQEPDTIRGGNDTNATAQRIPAFGSAKNKRPAARVLGTLAPTSSVWLDPSGEDDGSIPLAADTGLNDGQAINTTGTIGDGPHGSAGSGSGDFDFYAVSGTAGQRLTVDVTTPNGSSLDSVAIVFDASGEAIAGNDDDGESFDSYLAVELPATGDYYVALTGYFALPEDPFDSASGTGAESEGDYGVEIGLNAADIDVYAVNLRAGDVLSGSVSGAATVLGVSAPSGKRVFGSTQDATYLYPMASPLVGGGNAVVDHVAGRKGWHYVAVTGGAGNYDITLEAHRSGPETNRVTQTIFLDFDGARVNTGVFGGPGVRQLSPLSAFLGRWGLANSQQNALINRIVATVTENLKNDFAGQGTTIRILNSRDHADPWGKPNVSRIIVGGTIAQSGVPTIGIAQSIDPGNYETEETALVLLDVVSDPPAEVGEASFNYYLTPASNRVKFVGTALGNIISHEAGHYLGNWHVDQFNDVLNLMDAGGNYPLLYGVGPDGIGGTADDPDVDFGEDVLNPFEGFTGLENTHVRTRWALTR